jgi:hypothetical protein
MDSYQIPSLRRASKTWVFFEALQGSSEKPEPQPMQPADAAMAIS